MIFENEAGTTTKPPKLMNWDNDFEEFKWRFKNYIRIIDYTLLRPLEQGPHVPITTTPYGQVPKPVTSYDDNERKIFNEDHKAFSVLSVCLSREIAQTLRDYITAKGLWDALVSKFEGNTEMRNSKKGLLKGEFNMFNHVQGESVTSLIHRFETLITKIKSAGIDYDQIEINDKWLESLPYTWNSSVITIKRITNLQITSLADLISIIKSFDINHQVI
ncbi:uncharacterized protein LOC143570380 [Bidens hawaiensis]|uniref:uncharacterized protein LOC143570380 n=1 Tax=Bidens hawaiensis TaxID=980011 RepID=UPI00404B6A69